MSDWNDKIINEFRDNAGVVQDFAPAYLVLLHHLGRRSGTEYVAPVVYFPTDDDATIHVVASAAGAVKDPQWYGNLTAAGRAIVEVGTPEGIQTWDVTVEDLQGDEHRRVLDAIEAKAPGFADYEKKIDGARKMPVLALHRTS